MNTTRLSIIIPSFNSAKTIAETLDSVVKQNVSGVECIIIDGDSSDETLLILQEYSEKHPFISYISEPDKGIYDAMNKGIALSKGDYLFFLGSDDLFYNDTVLEELFNSPEFGSYDLIYGDVLFKYSRIRVGAEKDYLKLIKSLENICHQSIFYSKKLFEKLGNYDLHYPIYADFHFNIRCFRDASITTKYISKIIAIFNEKGASYFLRSKDRFLITTHEAYVRMHEDPVALYDTKNFLEHKVAELLKSKEYLLGQKIGNYVRKLRSLFRIQDAKK